MAMRHSVASAVSTTAVILASLALAALAGCSSGSGPAGSASQSPGPASSPVAAPGGGSQAQAQALARQLLSGVVVPPGTARLTGPVPAALSSDGTGPIAAAEAVSVHLVFRISEAMPTAFAFLRAHVPAGLSNVGTGQTTEHGTVASDEITGQESSVPAGIYLAGLSETGVPDTARTSLALADAEVIWFPARSAAEYLTPSKFGSVRVIATINGHTVQTIGKTITGQAAIASVAGLLDGLQAAPPIPPGHVLPPATYELTFLPVGARPCAGAGTGRRRVHRGRHRRRRGRAGLVGPVQPASGAHRPADRHPALTGLATVLG
jgi:hypothetical protein